MADHCTNRYIPNLPPPVPSHYGPNGLTASSKRKGRSHAALTLNAPTLEADHTCRGPIAPANPRRCRLRRRVPPGSGFDCRRRKRRRRAGTVEQPAPRLVRDGPSYESNRQHRDNAGWSSHGGTRGRGAQHLLTDAPQGGPLRGITGVGTCREVDPCRAGFISRHGCRLTFLQAAEPLDENNYIAFCAAYAIRFAMSQANRARGKF